MLSKTEIDRIMADPTKRILISSSEQVKSTEPGEQPKTYSGQWRFVNGKTVKDGFGKMIWPDGSFYEGQFEIDNMQGTGQMTQSNGDIYQGQWKNNMANGMGIFVDT